MSQNYFLIHTDNFINESELMHWKYIYKKKVNGKWRYYYDVGEASYIDGYTGKKPSSVVGYSRFETVLGKHKRERSNRASAVYDRARKNATNREYSSATQLKTDKKRVSQLGKKAVEAHTSYMKTPLGQLEKAGNAIKKSKKKVATLLRKIGDKLD